MATRSQPSRHREAEADGADYFNLRCRLPACLPAEISNQILGRSQFCKSINPRRGNRSQFRLGPAALGLRAVVDSASASVAARCHVAAGWPDLLACLRSEGSTTKSARRRALRCFGEVSSGRWTQKRRQRSPSRFHLQHLRDEGGRQRSAPWRHNARSRLR